jgi:hypothetical protein
MVAGGGSVGSFSRGSATRVLVPPRAFTVAVYCILSNDQHTQYIFLSPSPYGVTSGTKISNRPSGIHRQLKISYVDSVDQDKADAHSKPQRSPRPSRRDRVFPEGRRSSRAMDGDGKQGSKRLAIQTGHQDEERQSNHSKTPKGVRGSRDLRSPGANSTPIATARNMSGGNEVPDFITQTDANGNASTPRSESAINGARKSHPSGRKPKLHVNRRGRLSEDDDSDDDSHKGEIYSSDDPCDVFLESLRMMCCCLMEDVKPRTLTEQITQDSDDRPKLLGDLHPDDHGKKCLVLDLDETLVHSSFRAVPNADFVIPVQVCTLVFSLSVLLKPTFLTQLHRPPRRLKMLYTLYMFLNARGLMNFLSKWRSIMRLLSTLPALTSTQIRSWICLTPRE